MVALEPCATDHHLELAAPTGLSEVLAEFGDERLAFASENDGAVS